MKKTNAFALTQDELMMFKDVAAVFSRYNGRTRNFALQLVHSHFDLNKGEVLHETNDEQKRELVIKPIFYNDLPAGAHPTVWKISINNKIEVIQTCCDVTAPDPDPSGPEGKF